MLKLWLIRHGMTEGNRHQRYIGVTDESLCEEGRNLLSNVTYPRAQALFVSPLRRCRETARILFGDQEQRVMQYILADSIGGRLNSQKGSNFLPDARNCAIGKQVRLCPITTRFCGLHGMTESHHKFSATVFMFRLQKASASSTISAMVPSMRLLIFLFKGSFPFTAKAVRKGGFCLHREKGG